MKAHKKQKKNCRLLTHQRKKKTLKLCDNLKIFLFLWIFLPPNFSMTQTFHECWVCLFFIIIFITIIIFK